MVKKLCLLQLLVTTFAYTLYNPFQYTYPLANPYSALPEPHYGYNYAPQSPFYTPYTSGYTNEFTEDPVSTGFAPFSEVESTLNVLAELPYSMSEQFSVIPMWIVPEDSVNMVRHGQITSVSDQKPLITIKVNSNTSIQCTPTVRMVLEKPVLVESLRSNVLFPSEVQIIHDGTKIPIRIGSVIAPVLPGVSVSRERPIAVRVVYAVPSKPLKITITIDQDDTPKTQEPVSPSKQSEVVAPSSVTIDERFPEILTNPEPPPNNQDQKNTSNTQQPSNINEGLPSNNGFGALSKNPDYVNNADAIVVSNQEAVIVESESELPPKNVTIIDFPEKEAEPHLEVDEEDAELVNRNPPMVLAPAGIVQSTQPESHVEVFHNDKESPYLETLRQESHRKKL